MEIIEDRFQHCIVSILAHEGGLCNDKDDPGGITHWGISLRYLKSIGYDFNRDGVINAEDIIGIPKLGAVEIYRQHWWDAYRYAGFNELLVVEKVFDLAVNMGGYSSHKLLQIAINRLNDKPITVDGILGGQTFGAANGTDPSLLREQLRQCAKHRYIEILAEHPVMEWARKGWLNRAAW
jgi:lysozyme family protein